MGSLNRFTVVSMVLAFQSVLGALEGGWCGHDIHTCDPGSNGQWTRCSMCICENLNNFIHDAPTCSANNKLYNCYISYDSMGSNAAVGCKTEMKTAWIIGFTFSFSIICAICCIAGGYAGYNYYINRQNKTLYPDDEEEEDEEDETHEIETNYYS
jgi:hypothetical protein